MNHTVIGIKLIRELNNDKERALSAIFRRLYPSLCLYANTIIRERVAAEEIASEVFVKLWVRRDSITTEAHLLSFLYRVTQNACIDWLRKQETIRSVFETIRKQPEQEEKTHLQAMVESESYRNLHESFEKLPPKCKRIFHMIYIDGKNYQEIATELGITVNNVQSQRSRGVELLKQRKFLLRFF
ncbi:MAG: RNA polymerase sigma-70 factor [Chitinophagaceae bacterium]|nr:RNA polymerase sigma-70 factor [Chitinophagaceae bacterium]